MKLLQHSVKLQVRESSKGEPVSFTYGRRVKKVRRIGKRWRVSDGWWRKEVTREYFQIETDSGVVYDIYHDLLTKSWYLHRIYD